MLRREFRPIRSHLGDAWGSQECNPDRALSYVGVTVRQGCGGDGVPRGVPNVAKLAWVPFRAPLPVRLLKVYVGIDRRQPALPMLSQRVECWLSFTSSAYASLPPLSLSD